MKLSSFGNRYALAFALALAGALAACGGDDDDGTPGAGGTGGADAGRGGGGVAEASADRAPDRATGGAAGTGGTDSSAGGAAGTGGARPDAAEAAPGTGGSPEAAPDVPRPPDAPPDVPAPVPDARPDGGVDASPDVAREAEAGPAPGSDATDVTPAVEAAPDVQEAAPVVPEPVPEPVPEAAPPVVDAGSDAGTQLLYSFEANDTSVTEWRVDQPSPPAAPTAVSFITGGSPESPLGAIEFSGAFSETHSVYVDYATDPPIGLGQDPPPSYPGFTGVSAQVRLRNALDGGTFDNLTNVQLVLIGATTSGFATCFGDQNRDDILAGDWVTLTVTNCSTDAGSSALLDLGRIAVEVNIAQNDAGAIPIVLDVDNVVLTR